VYTGLQIKIHLLIFDIQTRQQSNIQAPLYIPTGSLHHPYQVIMIYPGKHLDLQSDSAAPDNNFVTLLEEIN
jgi:hypothetical protein